MLAGSVNAQDKPFNNSDARDLPPPGEKSPDPGEKILHLYKDIKGERYSLQVAVNEKTGNYELFKHYLTEEDDIFINKLEVTIKYLPDLDLEYPGGVKPRNKQESESMRASGFSCSTIPINEYEQGYKAPYSTGNNVYIQYNPEGGTKGHGATYGNAAICKENTGATTPPLKHHRLEYNAITQQYNGQSSHVPTIARYKWGPGNYGIGMYFGNAGGGAYPCSGGPYGGSQPQLSTHNTRIEAWWGTGSSGVTYQDTCGLAWGDNIWYKVYVDASTNSNNTLQTVKYWVNRWAPPGWPGNSTPGWIQQTHTIPVSKFGLVPNFDENATGLFIVATLPPITFPLSQRTAWTVYITELNTWWQSY